MKVLESRQNKSLGRSWPLCYLIAKDIDDVGCVALKTTHGKHLSKFNRSIKEKVGYEKYSLLLSAGHQPAHAEYEPYHFVELKEEFFIAVEIILLLGAKTTQKQNNL